MHYMRQCNYYALHEAMQLLCITTALSRGLVFLVQMLPTISLPDNAIEREVKPSSSMFASPQDSTFPNLEIVFSVSQV
jgi:hypothetical protein